MVQHNFKALQEAQIWQIISGRLEYLFNLLGREIAPEKLTSYVTELARQLPRRFPWLTDKFLEEIISMGASGDLGDNRFFDLKMLIGWIYRFSQASDEIKERILYATPVIPPTAQESQYDYDWQSEVNKCFYLWKNGMSVNDMHHCIYDRLMLDDHVPMNSYNTFLPNAKKLAMNPLNELEVIGIAKRLCVNQFFAYANNLNVKRIYNLNFFKAA